MATLRPIFWGQGMFLRPQHFQQLDVYNDTRLQQYLHLSSPFCWGIKSIDINETGLQSRSFEILSCQVVTSVGTILYFEKNSELTNTSIEAQSFIQKSEADTPYVSVYLGVKKLLHANNVWADEQLRTHDVNALTERRFRREVKQARNLYAETDQEERVPNLDYLTYNTRIFFDQPSSDDYEWIKIAEVRRSDDAQKRWELSDAYIPPCITIRSSEFLETKIKDVRDSLEKKWNDLVESRRQQGGAAELWKKDPGAAIALQTVGRYLPLFVHAVEIGDIHPFVAYSWLCQLVGEFSALSSSDSVWGARREEAALPRYNHEDLWRCFNPAVMRLHRLLFDVKPPPPPLPRPSPPPPPLIEVVLSHDGKYFRNPEDEPLAEKIFIPGNRHYLVVNSGRSEVPRLLQEEAYIASASRIEVNLRSFVRGLTVTIVAARELPPAVAERVKGAQTFLIEEDSKDNEAHWQHIKVNRSIALYCSGLDRGTEIRLLTLYVA